MNEASTTNGVEVKSFIRETGDEVEDHFESCQRGGEILFLRHLRPAFECFDFDVVIRSLGDQGSKGVGIAQDGFVFDGVNLHHQQINIIGLAKADEFIALVRRRKGVKPPDPDPLDIVQRLGGGGEVGGLRQRAEAAVPAVATRARRAWLFNSAARGLRRAQ